jgi:hypothetical protein
VSQDAASSASQLPLNQASDSPKELTDTRDGDTGIQTDQSTLPWNSREQNVTNDGLARGENTSRVIAAPDIWSAAYREAVESLGEETAIEALKGKDIAQLFQELENTEKEVACRSAFSKGVRYLQTLQIPLERFKQALDLAVPLASLEPTATTVVGVVRCVTAVSSAGITTLES